MSAEPNSIMAELKSNRERLKSDTTKLFSIPGWDSLYVEYKRIGWDQSRHLFNAISDDLADGGAQVGAAIKSLIEACVTFKYDNGETEKDLEVKYEQKLAEFIGETDATSPAEVVMAIMTDETTLMGHAGDYVEWVTRSDNEDEAELGKDLGGTKA
jgi:hypothetical protein